MDNLIEILKVTIPAALVLYAMYLVIRSFLTARMDEMKAALRQKNQEVVTPIRLQAYERIVLLLERINPQNIISRLNNPEFLAREFQQLLVMEIRQEFNHNLSQQLYMSDQAWVYVTAAVEDTISLINEAGGRTNPEAKSIDLVKTIFEMDMSKSTIPQALFYLKNEIRELF
jgi:hypothetical protein